MGIASARDFGFGNAATSWWAEMFRRGCFGRQVLAVFGRASLAARLCSSCLPITSLGVLTMADDPYAPYYPGDDAVDWVGMSLYHWGSSYPWGANALPEPGKFAALLTGQYRGTIGDETAVPDFYSTYANAHHKPVAITETAAFFAPSRPGDETAIKAAWSKQVFDPSITTRFPRLEMINWFEWDKYETEVKAEVDWAVTRTPHLARAFATDLPSRLLLRTGLPGRPSCSAPPAPAGPGRPARRR